MRRFLPALSLIALLAWVPTVRAQAVHAKVVSTCTTDTVKTRGIAGGVTEPIEQDSLHRLCVAANVSATVSSIDSIRKVHVIDSAKVYTPAGDTLVVKGSSGNPAGGRLDSVSLVHLGAADSVQLRTGTKHALRAAIDSLIGAARIVHACGAQNIGSTGNPYNTIYMDSTGALCTNASSTGGTHDTIIASPGLVLSGKTATAVANGIYTTLRVDTLGMLVVDTIRNIAGTVATTGGAADSVQLRTGTKHVGTVAADTAKGCLVAHNTCPINVVVDSVITGLHLGLTTDSVGVGVYTTKTTPAFVNNSWNRLTSDTAGRLRVKIDTAVTLNVVVPSGGAGLGAADSVQLRTGTKHYGRVTMDSVIHPVYSDSTVLIRKNVELVNADTVYTRVSDTVACQIGAKSAADSVTLPSHGGSTFFYMTSITVIPFDTLAIAASTTAYDSLTTTNFFSYGFRWGNAQTASFQSQPLLNQSFPYALKSQAAATATKFRLSAPGTGGYWGICVSGYYK